MASLTSLMSDVYVLTNRDDLVAETKLAVKKATLKMHHVDDFARDIFETAIRWDPVGYIQSLQYNTIHPRWRKLKYLRKLTDSTPGDFFTILTPEETLDRYNVHKENVTYLAGDMYEIRSNTADEFMLLGAYVSPDITDASYSSWIADNHPYAIITEAAATVFKMIGQDEKMSTFRQEVAEQIAMLKQVNIG